MDKIRGTKFIFFRSPKLQREIDHFQSLNSISVFLACLWLTAEHVFSAYIIVEVVD